MNTLRQLKHCLFPTKRALAHSTLRPLTASEQRLVSGGSVDNWRAVPTEPTKSVDNW